MSTPVGKWGEDETPMSFDLNFCTIAGDVAGDLTVTGIKKNDKIAAVVDVSAAGANLASEFTASAADTINNADGTDTTGMILLVIWATGEKGRTGY